MTKTLKITTILTAAAALGLIIVVASQGIASDKEIEKFLSAPGIAEQLRSGSIAKSSVEQETPLIRQAKAFALRINPPPPPVPVITPQPQAEIRPKVEVIAKFKLVGTSYHTGDEKNSWALIDEIGKGWHWVRPGEKIEHLIVEKIGDGVVLIRDGQRTYELATEKAEKPNFVKSFSGSAPDERIIPAWQGKQSAVNEAISEDKTSTINTENVQPAEDPNIIKKQAEENMKWIKQLQENPEAVGMTKEEANALGDLGEFLKTVESQLSNEVNEPNTSAKPKDEPRHSDGGANHDSNEPRQTPTTGVGAKQDANSPGQNTGPRGIRRIRRTR